MTGGGALIRGLDVLLQQETGLPIHLDEDPMTCVVRGTGRILDDPEKYRNVLTTRSEEHTSELQSQSNLVCRLLLEKKKPKHSVLLCTSNVAPLNRSCIASSPS